MLDFQLTITANTAEELLDSIRAVLKDIKEVIRNDPNEPEWDYQFNRNDLACRIGGEEEVEENADA